MSGRDEGLGNHGHLGRPTATGAPHEGTQVYTTEPGKSRFHPGLGQGMGRMGQILPESRHSIVVQVEQTATPRDRTDESSVLGGEAS